MANLKKTLSSGAEIDITLASFAEGHKLLKAVLNQVKSIKIAVPSGAKSFKDILNLDAGGETVNVIKDLITGIISSDEVEAALWPCMERTTYNNQRVVRDLFEEEKIRADYLIVAKEVLFYNLLPFFGNLVSLLKNAQAKLTDTQK